MDLASFGINSCNLHSGFDSQMDSEIMFQINSWIGLSCCLGIEFAKVALVLIFFKVMNSLPFWYITSE